MSTSVFWSLPSKERSFRTEVKFALRKLYDCESIDLELNDDDLVTLKAAAKFEPCLKDVIVLIEKYGSVILKEHC